MFFIFWFSMEFYWFFYLYSNIILNVEVRYCSYFVQFGFRPFFSPFIVYFVVRVNFKNQSNKCSMFVSINNNKLYRGECIANLIQSVCVSVYRAYNKCSKESVCCASISFGFFYTLYLCIFFSLLTTVLACIRFLIPI